jgi:hypothetical protein
MVGWFVFAFVFNLFSLSWLYTAYPLYWLPKTVQIVALPILHILVSCTGSISFTLVGILHFYLRKKKNIIPLALGIAVYAADMLRSICISILYYAKESSTIGLHYSASTFGNALSVTPLIEFAYYGGVFTLSGLLVVIIYIVDNHLQKKVRGVYVISIFIVWLLIHLLTPQAALTQDTRIIIINSHEQKENSSKEDWATSSDHIYTALLPYATTTLQVIVLPEDTRFFSRLKEDKIVSLPKLFPNTYFFDGDTLREKDTLSNVAVSYSPRDRQVFMRGKWFMFAFSEYIPSLFKPLFSIGLSKDELATYIHDHTYGIGSVPFALASPLGPISVLLCGEVVSHSTLLEVKRVDPSLVILQSHLFVFHGNPWFIAQYLSFTKIAAATLRVPLVVSAVDAPSMLISPQGHIINIFMTKNEIEVRSVNIVSNRIVR